ncbi:MAG TPA: DUF6232 family protein [Candidatus Limnocylindrales bacterium]|nr:DUF6232 family protein [Candidatus Limnocylindrales bacterium]
MSAELFQRPEIYYYRHNGTSVTSHYFTTPSARFHIRDLTRFAQSQRDAESGLKVGLVTAAVELVIVLPSLSILSPSVGLALIVPALVVPFLAAFAYGKRRPAEFELLANYRGQQRVTLFVTTDQQQFGQVARALVRAAEAADG